MKKVIVAAAIAMMCIALAGCADNTLTEETTEPETTMEATQASEPEYTAYSFVKEMSSPSLGYNMEVASVALTHEGDIIMRTKGDLAAAVGWQLTIATGVKNAYVEAFGNGDEYSIIMIREDGTVSVVNTSKLRKEKSIEIMDNLGDYQDVTGIEGEQTSDGSTINVVMSNGDKSSLDVYLK